MTQGGAVVVAATVSAYLVSAALLGIAIAMQSGTADAMVYDVLVEETGSGGGFIRQIDQVRLLEALGLTAGARHAEQPSGSRIFALLSPEIIPKGVSWSTLSPRGRDR